MNFEFGLGLIELIQFALVVLVGLLVVSDLFLELKYLGLGLDDLVSGVAHLLVKSDVCEDDLYFVADGSALFVQKLESMLHIAILALV